MNVQLLVDSLVQQTTVLIAQLSTAAGIRAPLSKIADQVFVELSRELSEQGVPRRIAAGMFGLPLRSYQKKLRRLQESQTHAGQTLWESVFSFVSERRHVRRDEVESHFRRDGEKEVGAVLNDLVVSGLVTQAGRGPGAVYARTSDEGLQVLWEGQEREHTLAQVWLRVHGHPGVTLGELQAERPAHVEEVERAVTELVDEGKLRLEEREGVKHLYASALVVEVGAEIGWELAVFDHFRAVVNAIATKVRGGTTASSAKDVTGGMTLSFEFWPGHPFEHRIRRLLSEVRGQVNALWQDVEAYNATQMVEESERARIYFYAGQYLEQQDESGVEELDRSGVDS